MLLHNLDGL